MNSLNHITEHTIDYRMLNYLIRIRVALDLSPACLIFPSG